jgi:hypothetical protein
MLLHILGWKFVREDEMPLPDNLAGLIERFKQTERFEMEWLSKASEPDLGGPLEARSLPCVPFRSRRPQFRPASTATATAHNAPPDCDRSAAHRLAVTQTGSYQELNHS